MTGRTLIVCVWLLACVAHASASDVPRLQGYVSDYAKMISPDTKARIESDLRALEQSDSTQIFLLTVPSLEGEVLEDFSIRVFDQWKAGQKGLDNGVIFIVAQKERKIRIEVGRGLEGKLTDLAAGRIIDLVIKPRFKEDDFDGGFAAGVAALMEAVKGEFRGEGGGMPVQKVDQPPQPDTFIEKVCGIIFLPLGILEKVLTFLEGFCFQRPQRAQWFFYLSGFLLAGMAIFSHPVKARMLRMVSGAVGVPVIALFTVWDPLSSEPAAGNPLLVLIIFMTSGGIVAVLSPYLCELGRRFKGGGSGSSSGSSSSSSSGGGGGSSGGGGASGGY